MPIFLCIFPCFILSICFFYFCLYYRLFFELVFLFRNIYDTWRLVLIKMSLRFFSKLM